MKILKKNKGFTIVEVVAVMLISSVIIYGLARAYAIGVKEFRSISVKYTMQEEAAYVLSYKLAPFIRMGENPNIIRPTELTLKYSDDDLNPIGRVDFYYDDGRKALMADDRRVGFNDFNIQLLPVRAKRSRRRFSTIKSIYEVSDVKFEYYINPDEDYNQYSDEYAITVTVVLNTVVLNNDRGDTVTAEITQFRYVFEKDIT